jgi:hypothetical protein
MFILDSLIFGGLRFVLDKVAAAVDRELDDETALREELLASEMRLELGEITEQEFAAREANILGRLREIREQRQGPGPATFSHGEHRVTGIEASLEGDEH